MNRYILSIALIVSATACGKVTKQSFGDLEDLAASTANVAPSGLPSGAPSGEPSGLPSNIPSGVPSGAPSGVPSSQPSGLPSGQPSNIPSGVPSGAPSGVPSGQPSGVPSGQPSNIPSGVPSSIPSGMPSGEPSGQPSGMPSGQPSGQPSSMPSGVPSNIPSGVPSSIPDPVCATDGVYLNIERAELNGMVIARDVGVIELHELSTDVLKYLNVTQPIHGRYQHIRLFLADEGNVIIRDCKKLCDLDTVRSDKSGQVQILVDEVESSKKLSFDASDYEIGKKGSCKLAPIYDGRYKDHEHQSCNKGSSDHGQGDDDILSLIRDQDDSKGSDKSQKSKK